MERSAAEAWVRAHVEPAAPLEVELERPWATVLRVPLADGAAWLKACGPVQAFEPRLTAALAGRWPDRLPEVLALDERRGWLLLADAGTPLRAFGDALDAWLALLPRYAELQRGEVAHVEEHLGGGVPDRRLERLPELYEAMLSRELPLEPEERTRLPALAVRFEARCGELAAAAVPASIQHDDLHAANVWARDGRLAVLDWGDACVSHPFASLVVTFRLLEEQDGLRPGDPWFARLRDAYLEPWGRPAELRETFELAFAVGSFAYVFGALRQWDAMPPEHGPRFEAWVAGILRRALALLEAR